MRRPIPRSRTCPPSVVRPYVVVKVWLQTNTRKHSSHSHDPFCIGLDYIHRYETKLGKIQMCHICEGVTYYGCLKHITTQFRTSRLIKLSWILVPQMKGASSKASPASTELYQTRLHLSLSCRTYQVWQFGFRRRGWFERQIKDG